VVIPAYNYERYLKEAVDSALTQELTGGQIEILVVDDGSTDSTEEICRGYGAKIHYHRKKNAGLSAARNTGMELAAHDRVLFLDADDVLEKSCVRRLCAAWDDWPERPVVVGSRSVMIDGEGRTPSGAVPGRVQDEVKAFSARDFALRNRFAPVVLADRRALLELGGFDTTLTASEDRDMWIRAAGRGAVLRVEEALHRKRDHGGNMSRQAERQTECILKVLQKARSQNRPRLRHADWRKALAVCFYQSARMHLAAGNAMRAGVQCLRSVLATPWLSAPGEVGLPHACRPKFLALLAAAQLKTFLKK
jgi:GT2 family glycosyltransferase